MTIKLLAVGDMHLGRQPSRLPETLAANGRRYGPSEAWLRTVELAIDHDVDVVALAGDLVEREDDFFEAYRDLRDGVERLAAQGIQVVGVAGNHDVLVLPRLADELPDFLLLGRGGQWQSHSIGSADETLTLHGWSFPRKQVPESPLTGHRFECADGVNLGLLHCDRDQRDSVYAPVTTAELEAAGLDGWLLGHIHRPDDLAAPQPSGYLGSLTGLHPGEHGDRGPWLMVIDNGRIESMEQQRLAPLHWHRMDLDLSDLEQPEQVEDQLLRNLKQLDKTLDGHVGPPDAVGLRIRLTGRTHMANEALQQLADRQGENVSGHTKRYAFIERVVSNARPLQDLGQLASEDNYIGLLAKRLLLLQGKTDDPQRRKLLDGARQRLERVAEEARWRGLERPSFDDDEVASRIADTGSRLIERLIEQREART